MQGKLERGKAAFHTHNAGSLVPICANVSLIAALAFCVPGQALAACGGAASRSAGIHAAGSGGGGIHAASAAVATSSGGGGGTLGCAGGSSASALRGLQTTSSGRVVELGAHATRTATGAGKLTTRTANLAVHLNTIGHAHRT